MKDLRCKNGRIKMKYLKCYECYNNQFDMFENEKSNIIICSICGTIADVCKKE